MNRIEGCHLAFTKRLRTITHLTTCACNACRSLDLLDLKFVVHCSQYAEHLVAGREKLVGHDVISVRRSMPIGSRNS